MNFANNTAMTMAMPGEFDAFGTQHRCLHQDHRSDGDVEIKRNEHELLEFVHCTLVQRGFRGCLSYHDNLLPRPWGYKLFTVSVLSAFTAVP
jgi:hypothetical protein